LRSDRMLLWASDWPHWQYDGDAAVPPGIPASLMPKLMRENALATYDRLREGALA
jgi:predicted TIM-barrel fold metal-dependent hydrolase